MSHSSSHFTSEGQRTSVNALSTCTSTLACRSFRHYKMFHRLRFWETYKASIKSETGAFINGEEDALMLKRALREHVCTRTTGRKRSRGSGPHESAFAITEIFTAILFPAAQGLRQFGVKDILKGG